MKSRKILLLALSARMLAQSARRGGWRPLALDWFADEDTAALSDYSAALPAGEAGLDEAAILAAIDRADPDREAEAFVYGSGIENYPNLLEKVSKDWPLCGNGANTVGLLRNPRTFFGLLDELEIPYPETRYTPPDQSEGWLVKHRRSEGGKGVFLYRQTWPPEDEVYFQRQVRGAAVSFSFLADGRTIKTIGFNSQWTTAQDGVHPYLFAGIVNRADIDAGHRAAIKAHARTLTEKTGLLGLNSLDYIYDGETCRLLEVNPRPGASLALYDEDYPEGLLTEHVKACLGRLTSGAIASRTVRGYAIVYARSRVTVPLALDWPPWTADRPIGGTTVLPGRPMCSILAGANQRSRVEKMLKERERRLLALFSNGGIRKESGKIHCPGP